LTTPVSELHLREAPENWPLLKRTLKSEKNFIITIAGEQFYLIRTLFEDSNNFDICIEDLSSKSMGN
jgi:hypothetical protein